MGNMIEYDIELLGIEYNRMQLLRRFETFCVDMRDDNFNKKVREFYRKTPNPIETTKAFFLSQYKVSLNDDDAKQMLQWIEAHLKKAPFRKTLSLELKKTLLEAQGGKCAICECDLGNDFSCIHIDHIVPWVLVGDELDDNYQDLCITCNKRKNKQVDYLYRKLVNLL